MHGDEWCAREDDGSYATTKLRVGVCIPICTNKDVAKEERGWKGGREGLAGGRNAGGPQRRRGRRQRVGAKQPNNGKKRCSERGKGGREEGKAYIGDESE